MDQVNRFDTEGLEFCCTATPRPEMLDYNAHLNIAYYGLLFEEAARANFSRIDISRAYRERSDCAIFAAEVHTVFHREVLGDEPVSIYFRLLDLDQRKIHSMFFMVKDRDGSLAAAQEILYLHVDLRRRRTAPIPEPQAGRLAALLEKHGRLSPPADAGRRVALRRQ